MKRYKFKKQELQIKSIHLEKMLDACISLPKLTRSEVSEYANVSLPTAGKFLSSLDECKFTKTLYSYPKSGRPFKEHSITEFLSSAIIDLTAKEPLVTVLKHNGDVTFYKKYEIFSDIAPFDNLSAILARSCLDLKNADVPVSSLSVILADDCEESTFHRQILPSIKDKENTCHAVAKVFGTLPINIMSFSDALAYAVKFNRLPKELGNNVAYIYTGLDVKLCYIPINQMPTNCNVTDLLYSDKETISEKLAQATTEIDFGKLLAILVNFAHCAFSPTGYVIEYDNFKFGSVALSELKRSFALLSRPLPPLVAQDHSLGLHIQGAAAAGERNLISLYITSFEDN